MPLSGRQPRPRRSLVELSRHPRSLDAWHQLLRSVTAMCDLKEPSRAATACKTAPEVSFGDDFSRPLVPLMVPGSPVGTVVVLTTLGLTQNGDRDRLEGGTPDNTLIPRSPSPVPPRRTDHRTRRSLTPSQSPSVPPRPPFSCPHPRPSLARP